MHYTTKKITVTVPTFGTFVLIRMSLTPDQIEVYRVESDGMESWCDYLSNIPMWAGRGMLERYVSQLDAQSWNQPGHPSLQLTLAA